MQKKGHRLYCNETQGRWTICRLNSEILQSENYNSVLLYKPQGSFQEEMHRICADSFVLAIQTQFQREIFQKFGSEILCIDSTHSTNAYGFKLITCLVADHHGQGTCTVR